MRLHIAFQASKAYDIGSGSACGQVRIERHLLSVLSDMGNTGLCYGSYMYLRPACRTRDFVSLIRRQDREFRRQDRKFSPSHHPSVRSEHGNVAYESHSLRNVIIASGLHVKLQSQNARSCLDPIKYEMPYYAYANFLTSYSWPERGVWLSDVRSLDTWRSRILTRPLSLVKAK